MSWFVGEQVSRFLINESRSRHQLQNGSTSFQVIINESKGIAHLPRQLKGDDEGHIELQMVHRTKFDSVSNLWLQKQL